MGLGPGDRGGLSVSAYQTLLSAERVLLRTRHHPVVAALEAEGMQAETCDPLYESAECFDALYDQIASTVLERHRSGDIVYAVPGSPLLGERTVSLLFERCAQQSVPLRVIPSVSCLDASLALVRVPVNTALEVLHAPDIAHFPPAGVVPLFIFGLYDKAIASEVKISLMEVYPDHHPLTLLRAAGVEGQETREELPLYGLDRTVLDHLTSLYVPALRQYPPGSFERLLQVMDALRDPGGCPWDREQTHQSLKKYLLEEAYEFFDAIDDEDDDRMADELGDLLLQVVFHARIAREEGRFDIHDAIRSIVEKLLRRHPHVFGDTQVAGTDEVLDNWEAIKSRERLTAHRRSLLDAVPRAMPALQRAYQFSRRAAKVGFDWPSAADVWEKVSEEMEETRQAMAAGDERAIRQEIGDLFFTLVNLARKAGIDPENALEEANRRFSERFRYLEQRAGERGLSLAEMSLPEMDALWNEAKTQGR